MQISALSNDKALSFDVILVSLGTRYQMYCANASRTYLVDPSKKQVPSSRLRHRLQHPVCCSSWQGFASRCHILLACTIPMGQEARGPSNPP